jgi:uncharacterized protein YndB with AHSA1/START domain
MPNIRHELLIAAPADKVYAALTSQQGLAGWWTPGAKAKAEQGSIAHFDFGPDYFKEMKIESLEPSKHVEWRCTAGVQEWVGTALSFELHEGGSEALLKSHPEAKGQLEQHPNLAVGTLVAFAHDNWKNYTPMFAECSYTWGRFLRSLKLVCETGAGTPWPHQHQRGGGAR